MNIKARAFESYLVTIVDVYDDLGVMWAICVDESEKLPDTYLMI